MPVSKEQKDKISKGLASAGGALGTAGAVVTSVNILNERGSFDKLQLRYEKGKTLYVVYTDPKRGAGHYAQAKALEKELKTKGIKYKMVAIEDYMGKSEVKEIIGLYHDWADDPKNANKNLKLLRGYDKLWKSWDKKAFLRDLNNSGGVISMHPWIQFAFEDVKKPVSFVYTDPAVRSSNRLGPPIGTTPKQVIRNSLFPKRLNYSYYLTETVEKNTNKGGIPKKNLRRIHNMPIDMSLKTKQFADIPKGAAGYMDPKNFNVVIAGGGQGLDVNRAAAQLLDSNTKQVDGKKVVFHVITGGGWGKREKGAQRLKHVRALAQSHPGQLVVHEQRVPLLQMMNKADFLVVQPHGTSGTEAVLARTPGITFVQDPMKNGKYVSKDYYFRLANNAEHFNRTAGLPMSSTGFEANDVNGKNKDSNISKVFDEAVANRSALQKKVNAAAAKLDDTPARIVKDLTQKPKSTSRLMLRGLWSKRSGKAMATTGAVAGGAAILNSTLASMAAKKKKDLLSPRQHKYIQKTLSRTGKVRYIYPKKK